MYPRNAASPEPIAIGAVVQISDGAVQTSGCTVRIIPNGVAEGNGAGTTSYSTDGVVYYTPTQVETNYTSFILIAKKTGCIPASITVVTSASATAGKVVLSGETHTNAVIPRVTLVDTTTTNSDMRGTDGAYTGTPPTAAAIADQVWDEATSGHTTAGTFGAQVKTSIDTILDRLGSWTGSGVNTILGAFQALLSKVASAPSDIGGTFDPAADSTEAISEAVAGLAISSGSGAYTLTITVDDGTDPLQSATVRLTEGVTTLTGTTDANGQVAFSVDAATWAVAITKAGYQFTPTTKVVSATGSQTYSMSAVSISASPVGTVTGYFTCLGTDGAAESGVTFTLQQIKVGAAKAGYDSTARTTTSATTTGLVQFTGMIPGGRYWLTRGDSTNETEGTRFTVPSDATSPWLMDAVLGSP